MLVDVTNKTRKPKQTHSRKHPARNLNKNLIFTTWCKLPTINVQCWEKNFKIIPNNILIEYLNYNSFIIFKFCFFNFFCVFFFFFVIFLFLFVLNLAIPQLKRFLFVQKPVSYSSSRLCSHLITSLRMPLVSLLFSLFINLLL